jgi:hypothetical protein
MAFSSELPLPLALSMDVHYKFPLRARGLRLLQRVKLDHKFLQSPSNDLSTAKTAHSYTDSEILSHLRDLQPSSFFAVSVSHVCRMICENPTRLFRFLKSSHIQMLTEALKDLKTQRIALYSFCYIAQLLQGSTELIRLLKRNDFFQIIANLLASAPDSETQGTCLYLASHCAGVSPGFRKCLVLTGIVDSILRLVADDARTVKARCYFLRHAAEYPFDPDR